MSKVEIPKVSWVFSGENMYNIILDRLPTEYEGFLIRTSFRIGIQISLCLQDSEYTNEEQLFIALNLLYGAGIPDDINLAIKGLNWFLAGGSLETAKKSSQNEKQVFYWDFDSSRLFSSFRKTYGIDLATEDMHWFKFCSLMGSLDEDCAFSKAIEIRTYDMKDLKGKARSDMQKMKNDLTPAPTYSKEEQEQIDLFNSLLDGGDVNG